MMLEPLVKNLMNPCPLTVLRCNSLLKKTLNPKSFGNYVIDIVLNILDTHSRFVSETLSGSSSSVRAWRTRTTGWPPWSCSTPSPCWREHWMSSWMMKKTDIHSDFQMLLFIGRFLPFLSFLVNLKLSTIFSIHHKLKVGICSLCIGHPRLWNNA